MHKFLFKFKDTRNFGVIVDHTAIISAENPFQATEIAKEKFQHCGEISVGVCLVVAHRSRHAVALLSRPQEELHVPSHGAAPTEGGNELL